MPIVFKEPMLKLRKCKDWKSRKLFPWWFPRILSWQNRPGSIYNSWNCLQILCMKRVLTEQTLPTGRTAFIHYPWKVLLDALRLHREVKPYAHCCWSDDTKSQHLSHTDDVSWIKWWHHKVFLCEFEWVKCSETEGCAFPKSSASIIYWCSQHPCKMLPGGVDDCSNRWFSWSSHWEIFLSLIVQHAQYPSISAHSRVYRRKASFISAKQYTKVYICVEFWIQENISMSPRSYS